MLGFRFLNKKKFVCSVLVSWHILQVRGQLSVLSLYPVGGFWDETRSSGWWRVPFPLSLLVNLQIIFESIIVNIYLKLIIAQLTYNFIFDMTFVYA